MTKKILSLVFFISLIFATSMFMLGVFSFSKTQKLSDEELVRSYLSLADFYYAQGDLTLAVENYENVLKIENENIEALLGYGKAAINEGVIAPHYFQKVLEKDPQNKQANFYMGLISLDAPQKAKDYLALADDYELAKKNTILELIDAWPSEFSSYLFKRLLIAQADIAIGENKLAISLLRAATKERPDYRDAWILLGQAYYNNAQYKEALDCFKAALSLDGDNEMILKLIEKAEISVRDK